MTIFIYTEHASIKGPKTILEDCLSRLVDVNLNIQDYKPEEQEFRCIFFENPPIFHTWDSASIDLVSILHAKPIGNKTLQQNNPYCKHIL